jgi:branched-chain amino acid transport system permease protein
LPAGFETWRFVVYPLVLLVMMLLRPEGLLGRYELPFLRQVFPAMRKGSTVDVAPVTSAEEVAA